MELEAQAREQVVVVEGLSRPLHEGLQPLDVFAAGAARGKLGGEALHAVLRGKDPLGADAGQLELDGKRFGEMLRVAARDARAAADAAPDVHHSHGLQRAQGVARGHAGNVMTGGEILLGPEEIARPIMAFEKRVAYRRHDARRQGFAGARGSAALRQFMNRHAGMVKDNIFCGQAPSDCEIFGGPDSFSPPPQGGAVTVAAWPTASTTTGGTDASRRWSPGSPPSSMRRVSPARSPSRRGGRRRASS